MFDGLPTDAYTVSATEDFLVIPMADPRILQIHWRCAMLRQKLSAGIGRHFRYYFLLLMLLLL